MSPQSSDRNAAPDIYVGLLFVAVSALIAGCIILILQLNKYDWTALQ